LCEEVPRQKAAESRKIPESGSVIPREGVERKGVPLISTSELTVSVIPREGVESLLGYHHPIYRELEKVIPREGVESRMKSMGSYGLNG
jgi:hypothetical protein